jgi:hypothetical protein
VEGQKDPEIAQTRCEDIFFLSWIFWKFELFRESGSRESVTLPSSVPLGPWGSSPEQEEKYRSDGLIRGTRFANRRHNSKPGSILVGHEKVRKRDRPRIGKNPLNKLTFSHNLIFN